MALWAAFKAVVSAAFGVRRGAAAREDVKLKPLQVIVAALIAAGLFVGALLLLVNWIS
ncbi:DUF2970 domain-containing protein [Crenobacter cavernae]|uniref:DUF2970 domain-containing protein n=1 Tax=Crenobacter cavernae TaxID=2290923 RepID=A0A345Y5E7_9NEIS|nr:DUF2970 domain-containing protein [Crenobacter cavernae]AXK39149.1 DUF2970 domain-containing protein [Crenobacter cavernae]RXZ44019.1 DUF2970 domain-containing protein [Crenobacter cavernae]